MNLVSLGFSYSGNLLTAGTLFLPATSIPSMISNSMTGTSIAQGIVDEEGFGSALNGLSTIGTIKAEEKYFKESNYDAVLNKRK